MMPSQSDSSPSPAASNSFHSPSRKAEPAVGPSEEADPSSDEQNDSHPAPSAVESFLKGVAAPSNSESPHPRATPSCTTTSKAALTPRLPTPTPHSSHPDPHYISHLSLPQLRAAAHLLRNTITTSASSSSADTATQVRSDNERAAVHARHRLEAAKKELEERDKELEVLEGLGRRLQARNGKGGEVVSGRVAKRSGGDGGRGRRRSRLSELSSAERDQYVRERYKAAGL
ncbi:hypothetical protein FN846DRAFT_887699 [Sphaerosporella brunnea]|uniref:Uncharacterized protein n=1 Tax=Sphaerosporella brunnea TaxID=1250544 RepID=A0A5J5F582_9PEZI|nr:hypothetical protein FN846DRAFT_887699 [Sphaerosporella brunnea]